MLTLTRQKKQTVVITDSAGQVIGRIAVTSIRGGKVRLSFDFPRTIRIDREEVVAARAAVT